MSHYRKNPEWKTEFVFVVIWAFGIIVIQSIGSFAGLAQEARLTDFSIIGLLLYEIFVGGVLAWYLLGQGWTLKKIGLIPTLSSTAIGIVLALTVYAIWIPITWFLEKIDTQLVHLMSTKTIVGKVYFANIVAISLLNPLFEESILSGYIITVLKNERNRSLAINVSVAIRLACHLYQGAMAISLIPLGLLFATYFARTGKLWPVIIAHAALDYFALTFYQRN